MSFVMLQSKSYKTMQLAAEWKFAVFLKAEKWTV